MRIHSPFISDLHQKFIALWHILPKRKRMKRIAIKIGSNVLSRADGKLDITQMSALVEQIAELYHAGYEIILVSSGAVAAGRGEIGADASLDEVSSRQLYSAIGQAKLINRYYDFFREQGIRCGQVLTQKESFSTPMHRETQRHCMEVMLAHGVIPIVNENDTISITELMFTDNDELAGLMAEMMHADLLIILSNVAGIYTGNPSDADSRLIPEIHPGDRVETYIQSGKSAEGRGGMASKAKVALRVAEKGIPVVIAHGRRSHVLTDLMAGKADVPCTRFVASPISPCSSDNTIQLLVRQAAGAVSAVQSLTDETVASVLEEIAASLKGEHQADILRANAEDLMRMDTANPKRDRLLLTPARLDEMARELLQVAHLPSPLHRTLAEWTRPNGMKIRKVSVPFGVVGIIYEARPNVTTDVFALCLKSGNVCVLKGGSDAQASNRALVALIQSVLQRRGLNPAICTLLPPEREAAQALLQAEGLVDLVIPRGGKALIRSVREQSRIPVIETGAGVCHTYFDAAGDVEKGRRIILNAKTRRVSVCNALDSLLIHRERLDVLPTLCRPLAEKQVVLYADEEAMAALQGHYPQELLQPATDTSFGTEFLDYKMSIRTIGSLEEALRHIHRYGSRHSECIVSEEEAAIRRFEQEVDAACVYANVATSFTDGAQFGFGAEIGISTQKLHARGPMALPELTTYKYIISGNGQIRT